MAQRAAILAPINNLYGFWNNGSADLLKKALSIVMQQRVVGDRVVSRARLTGHFTGKLDDTQGKGQPIDFLRVQGGKATDNWHLEDKLGFEQQAGLLPK